MWRARLGEPRRDSPPLICAMKLQIAQNNRRRLGSSLAGFQLAAQHGPAHGGHP